MADFGVCTIPTHLTIQPVELARWAETNGFESVWFGEHTHIPASRKTPFPLGGELPEYYKQFFDPFIALTAAAAVTQKLKVGTSVCLVTEHPPITLAKTIACLDRVSNGRFLLGIGSGWNVEEWRTMASLSMPAGKSRANGCWRCNRSGRMTWRSFMDSLKTLTLCGAGRNPSRQEDHPC